MTTEQQLIALLRRAMGTEPAETGSIAWERLLSLTQFHRVGPLAYFGAKGLPEVPPAAAQTLTAAYYQEVFRQSQQEHAVRAIGDVLCEARVPHVLLRGALLKSDYPEPAMRSMSDLDYLVRVEDYPAIQTAVERLGARHIHTDGGHFSFQFPPQVMVEFHPALIYTASPVGTAINPGWQYVRPESGPHVLELTEEGFYLNLLCHLAYHFAKGGTGVRSVLDVWVYRHRHPLQPDRGFVERELERAGLLPFARNIEALSEIWFGNAVMKPELEELGKYILSSGAYGFTRRAVLNAASFATGKRGLSALKSRAFYPRRELENRFPWVKGRLWLLPAAWALRAWTAVTKHGTHIVRWSRAARSISREELRAQRTFLKRFGLIHPEKERMT
ncbi:MAG: nucleotidyltransferase family protein [Eubacteriales bacterium]|nr:nucleotidyltransferase family protein [Eubacteriales bacterium]